MGDVGDEYESGRQVIDESPSLGSAGRQKLRADRVLERAEEAAHLARAAVRIAHDSETLWITSTAAVKLIWLRCAWLVDGAIRLVAGKKLGDDDSC